MEMEINCKFPLAHSGRQQIRTAHNPSTGPIKQTIRSLSIQKNAGVRRCVSSTAARICSSIFSVCSPTHGTFLFFFENNDIVNKTCLCFFFFKKKGEALTPSTAYTKQEVDQN